MNSCSLKTHTAMSFEALWNVTEIAKFTVVSNGPMNDTTSAFYCAGGFPDGICGGICPNPDISMWHLVKYG